MMQKVSFCLAPLWLLVLVPASPVSAETGPCVSDQAGVMTCGQGPGAARVVDGTTSPSKRLAFAWRAPGRLPTGESVANHMGENVVWSPNSRLAIEEQDSKWSTDFLRLYAIGADDKVLVLDLQKIIEPAVRKRLRQLGRTQAVYTFSVEDSPTVDDRGLVRVPVLMQIPKQIEDSCCLNFDVTLQVSQKNGALSAADVSVRRSRTKS
jgi:hypothetical protein